jgi:hypothetical protein
MSSLGVAKSSLSDATSSLGDAKSSLSDATSSLGDAKSSLGDVKSSLGDATSSLGDATSSLGDAKSFLGVVWAAAHAQGVLTAEEEEERSGAAGRVGTGKARGVPPYWWVSQVATQAATASTSYGGGGGDTQSTGTGVCGPARSSSSAFDSIRFVRPCATTTVLLTLLRSPQPHCNPSRRPCVGACS